MLPKFGLLAFFFLALPVCAAEPPPLLVVIVVDQMRADYLDRVPSNSQGGLARLAREGAVFTHARHPHVPTETSPGHAAIMTGRYPFQHGIVGNEWFDRELGRAVYSVDDSLFGKSPKNMAAYTFGDALKAKDSESKVVSLSGKDRAAILMGGKRPDLAIWYDGFLGEFATSNYYGKLPAWVSELNEKRRVDENYFSSHPEISRSQTTAPARAPATYYTDILFTPFVDQIILELTDRVVDETRIGRGAHEDILAISFSATDYIGHRYGPDSPQMAEQIKELNGVLGHLLDMLDLSVGKGRYVVVLSADHGVLPVPEGPRGKAMGARRVLKNDFLDQAEAALEKKIPLPSAIADRWFVAFYPPNVYLNRTLAKTLAVSYDKLVAEASEAVKGTGLVAQVFSAANILEHHMPDSPFAETFSFSYFPGRSGDLMILPKEGILLTANPEGTGHGVPYDYDARVPLVFFGLGIKPGRYDRVVLATDIAPTVAKILGVPYATAPGGRVLDEIFLPQ